MKYTRALFVSTAAVAFSGLLIAFSPAENHAALAQATAAATPAATATASALPASLPVAPAPTITVNTLDDFATGCPTNCSLRSAITTAKSGDVIGFSPTTTGTLLLTDSLKIDKSLTIVGPGADKLTLDGTQISQVVKNEMFQTAPQTTVQFFGLNIHDGTVGVQGTLTAVNCLLAGTVNGAFDLADNSSLLLLNSTITGSYGIQVAAANATLVNDTLVGDGAHPNGYGVYLNTHANVTILGSTITKENTGVVVDYSGGVGHTLNLTSALIAGNVSDVTLIRYANSFKFTSGGHNLIGQSHGLTGFFSSDVKDVKPGLAAAAINPPGLLPTVALTDGSPAIGKGNCLITPLLNTDERGAQRKNPCDIGAYESGTGPATPTGQ